MAADRWTGDSFENDQYSSLKLVDISFGGALGVIVRGSADTNANRDYYYFIFQYSGTSRLGKCVNGTDTELHSAAVSWSVGDYIELECEGTEIRACKNGSPLGGSFTVTDTSLSSGAPGICGWQVANDPTGDDWEGGNLGGSIVPSAMANYRMRVA
jgi:hypothetical protein